MICREKISYTGSEKRISASRGRLKRRHVIESMVQLLANGLVLQLLSIQLVCRSEVNSQVQAGGKDSSSTDKPKAA